LASKQFLGEIKAQADSDEFNARCFSMPTSVLLGPVVDFRPVRRDFVSYAIMNPEVVEQKLKIHFPNVGTTIFNHVLRLGVDANFGFKDFFRILRGMALKDEQSLVNHYCDVIIKIVNNLKQSEATGVAIHSSDFCVLSTLRNALPSKMLGHPSLGYFVTQDGSNVLFPRFPYFQFSRNQSHDHVFVYEAVHRVDIPFLMFYECFRILKVGGMIHVCDYDVVDHADLVWMRFLHKLLCKVKDCEIRTLLSADAVAAMLRFIGFVNIKICFRGTAYTNFYLYATRGSDNNFSHVVKVDQPVGHRIPRVTVRFRAYNINIQEGMGVGYQYIDQEVSPFRFPIEFERYLEPPPPEDPPDPMTVVRIKRENEKV